MCFTHVQLFVTPWTVAHQALLSMGFSSREQWSGLPFPPPGGLPGSGIISVSPVAAALQADFLPTEPPGEACNCHVNNDVLCLDVSDSLQPHDCSRPGSSVHADSPGNNTGVSDHALLQGTFPTQGSNSGLLHYRRVFYHLSHQRTP